MPDRCRRVQQAVHGHRRRKHDPLYRARRPLHTGGDLLTDKQTDRLSSLFGDDRHVEVEATWGIYQRMVAAYREPDRAKGRELITKFLDSLSGVPKALTEIITLGLTLKKAGLRTCWRTATAQALARGRPRPSTAGSNTSVAPRSGSAT